jgi:hypothetical protein
MGPASAWTHSQVRTDVTSVRADGIFFFHCVRADGARVRTSGPRIHADGSPHQRGRGDYSLGNFKTDATVRLSHRQSNSHRPRPSVLVCLVDNPDSRSFLGVAT